MVSHDTSTLQRYDASIICDAFEFRVKLYRESYNQCTSKRLSLCSSWICCSSMKISSNSALQYGQVIMLSPLHCRLSTMFPVIHPRVWLTGCFAFVHEHRLDLLNRLSLVVEFNQKVTKFLLFRGELHDDPWKGILHVDGLVVILFNQGIRC